MGWSCRADAGRTMDKWSEACRVQTGSLNMFEANGSRYFWETSCTEYDDGAITGSVFKILSTDPEGRQCRKVGSFRIEPDGKVSQAPAWLKAAA